MNYSVPPLTRIGHVHLKVSDLERALGFYQELLGFELMQKYGTQAAFISAGGYHHHIGLNTWYSKGAEPALRIMVCLKLCIWMIRMAMGWNCIGTNPKNNGRWMQPVICKW